MKLASTFPNRYGTLINLSRLLADKVKYSLPRRQPDLVLYLHPLRRVVDPWQSEKQVDHLREMTAKAVMSLFLKKTPFRLVWMLCVAVNSRIYSYSISILPVMHWN